MRFRLAAALVAAAAISAAYAQVAPPSPATARPGDWPMYNRDLAGTRHSPLTQITPANVSRLTRAWAFKMGPDPSGGITGGSEYTPLVVNGVMYVNTARATVALDAATGKEIWRHDLDAGSPSKRGLSFWPGNGDTAARVYFTAGRRLIALEAEIGRRAEGFGKNGEVDMGQTYNGSPTLYKDLLLVGTNTPPGSVRAFDARTGARRWEFLSIPQGEGGRGQESWLNGAWKGHGGAISWAF